MIKAFSIFFLLLHFVCAAQSEIEGAKMKSEEVVRLMHRHFPIRTRIWNFDSPPLWKPEEKYWIVSVYQYKHSNKGQCKYTNGCTIVRHLVVVIDDSKKKIISQKKTKSFFHNYE
jgi:hypothetical protein